MSKLLIALLFVSSAACAQGSFQQQDAAWQQQQQTEYLRQMAESQRKQAEIEQQREYARKYEQRYLRNECMDYGPGGLGACFMRGQK